MCICRQLWYIQKTSLLPFKFHNVLRRWIRSSIVVNCFSLMLVCL
uniref:Uncharacterized protein n=1 Tax=Rhizophora mucronata TaxID=61149 RepID=A0A2P2QYP1_RHIMU